MAFVHGKGTQVLLNSVNLSAFTNNVEFGRTADSHDVTTFGKNSHVYQAGLKDGTCTIEGIYESVAVTGGPPAIIKPLVGGAAVPFVYRPEGTSAGLPEAEVDVIVTSYDETAPVADMITWSAELQFSDDIDDTAQ